MAGDITSWAPPPRCSDPKETSCAAVQYSDTMVCRRCNLAWDTNDPARPTCTRLPTVYDGVLHNWPGIGPDSTSYPFLALARRLRIDYGVVLEIARLIKRGFGSEAHIAYRQGVDRGLVSEVGKVCKRVG